MPNSIAVYSIYHLNLAFSSIEEEQRPEVIEKCYWPLLKLAKNFHMPLGIEATGYTLETIETLDPAWVRTLKDLCQSGLIEFVGSGYSQMIGPLVPPEITRKNLALGDKIYQRLLGLKPRIALVNEQAYAPGLIPLYIEAGYDTLVMDYAEPASHHPEWPIEVSNSPQTLIGPDETLINILWSNAIVFQQFQRFAHNQITSLDYFRYIEKLVEGGARAIPLYTSDGEIFDYRPGRFQTEILDSKTSEWDMIAALYQSIRNDARFSICLPSQALEITNSLPKHRLKLETAAVPTPVKKQRKYNVNRWALTGRNDLSINTACWKIFKHFQQQNNIHESDWQKLCYLWSSDFRTHITSKRWQKFCAELEELLTSIEQSCSTEQSHEHSSALTQMIPDHFQITQTEHILEINSPHIHLSLMPKRGLAISGFRPTTDSNPLAWIGTIPHGFYEDIAWGADFYSGHLTAEHPGNHKTTDLCAADPHIAYDKEHKTLVIKTALTIVGHSIEKIITLHNEPKITVEYQGIDWLLNNQNVMRCANITLNPALFDANSLSFKTANGGDTPQQHKILDPNGIHHGEAVSMLVSSHTALGVTNEEIVLSDHRREIIIQFDKADAAMMALLHFEPVGAQYFARCMLSLSEIDDTRKMDRIETLPFLTPEVRFHITLNKK